mmetsp:Transcript_34618/g.104343  ORF Transcript_34618/g.104343 Transcript_34618/m.104343 type:complete len:253 (+) Transcript_34618:171-929(+)
MSTGVLCTRRYWVSRGPRHSCGCRRTPSTAPRSGPTRSAPPTWTARPTRRLRRTPTWAARGERTPLRQGQWRRGCSSVSATCGAGSPRSRLTACPLLAAPPPSLPLGPNRPTKLWRLWPWSSRAAVAGQTSQCLATTRRTRLSSMASARPSSKTCVGRSTCLWASPWGAASASTWPCGWQPVGPPCRSHCTWLAASHQSRTQQPSGPSACPTRSWRTTPSPRQRWRARRSLRSTWCPCCARTWSWTPGTSAA